jgi:predicted O-methyltransferase YrrM
MQVSEEMDAYFTGSLWPAERNKLVELANSSKGEFIIEVGVLRGKTTKYLLDNTDKKVIAIDPYEMTDGNNNEEIKSEFLNSCKEYIESGRLFHIPQRSENAHRFLTPYMVKNCSLVFIDWDANGEQHLKDFKEYTPYIADDGYLVAHDFYDSGTLEKHRHISHGISEYMKFIDKPICWQSILYYPKHSEMSECMLYYGGNPDFFYVNRSRGLVWCSPNS